MDASASLLHPKSRIGAVFTVAMRDAAAQQSLQARWQRQFVRAYFGLLRCQRK
jgi:hypothetical protein